MNRALLTIVALALAASTALAGEIGFEEDYALAKDRTAPLKQLIPGTEDYYFYQCLYFQTSGQLDKVDETLKPWIERYGENARVNEIRNRQALLRYGQDPQKSLAYLIRTLDLQFNHRRERLDQKSDLATSLDPSAISRETLTRRAMGNHENLQGFEDAALDWLAAEKLTGLRLRDLLQRLRRPDYAGLPAMIVSDLAFERSAGFGAMEIHRLLLQSQLDECLTLRPGLLNETRFVNIYLSKLRPGADLNWQQLPEERQAYLDRLWDFVKRLSQAHNSLKASVLYHRLVLDRERGQYDKDRFMEYIKLPRPGLYVEPTFLERRESRDYRVDLNANFEKDARLLPIADDEELVRSYLMQFFIEADSWKPFDTYIRDDYLKRIFAETKIVNGLGDQESWFAMLTPQEYQNLKERIDLDFAYTNQRLFGPEAPVGLDVFVKNVKSLIVKVFEVNALNYYRTTLREVDTSINLDGLVANEEKVYNYDDPPLRRVKRHFDFPALQKRGVYIIDFIGNGKSSRALLQKGQLRFISRTSSAGELFTVLNESNQVVKEARLWLAGHLYEPSGAEGRILVPFSNTPGTVPIVLSHGEFAALTQFEQAAENYSLAAAIYVDREAILRRKTAEVIIRPLLYLNNTPVTLQVLEEQMLTITSTDLEGVSTTKEVRDFKLFEDRESTYEFRVPDRLARIVFTLSAKVKNLSQNKKVNLSANREFTLNGIDATDRVEDLFLGHVDGKYVLDVLGKTGEAKAGRPVNIDLKHRDFRENVHSALQTDAQGRIMLGDLKDIVSLTATGPEGTAHTWHMVKDQHSYPAAIQGKAGDVIAVPYMGRADQPQRSELSFLEMRDGTFAVDRFSSLQIKNGLLLVQDLPAGNYNLLLKDSGTSIAIRLAQGELSQGYALGNYRHLEVRNAKPLQISSIAVDGQEVRIKLENSSKFARVHLMATRYLPAYTMPGLKMPGLRWSVAGQPESVYVAGREIGDEYRYIIDRKYAAKFPGNMLDRPGLLLNPWALTKTETDRQEAQGGMAGFDANRGGSGGGASEFFGVGGGGKGSTDTASADLDFLGSPSVVLVNLEPDADGLVTVKREELGDHQQLHVLAIDPENTVYREVSLPEIKAAFQDLRLQLVLDPKQHFTEQKEITVVQPGQEFVLPDITTATFEAYDTVGKMYTLYLTLSNDATLAEFKFLLDWPKLKDAEKREKYSKYACHELNFFLSRRDPAFFKNVVQPYLKNKKDKTYLDRWLIGEELATFQQPWSFARLNIVERSLLGQRVKAEEAGMARHVKDLYDLLPPNVERFNFLFKTALKASSLETADSYDLGRAVEKAEGEKLARLNERAAGPVEARLRAPAPAVAAAPSAEDAPTPMDIAGVATPARRMAKESKDEASKKQDRDAVNGLAMSDAKTSLSANKPKSAAVRKSQIVAKDAELSYLGDGEELQKREQARQFYRKLEKTEELAENNYYHRPIAEQRGDLVTVNAFWRDYAARGGQAPFLTTSLAEASRNFTEIMFALAMVDLPFAAAEHATAYQGQRMTLKAGGPMIVYHKEIKAAETAAEKPILVSQNFFRVGDQYRFVDNERIEKYVTDEFLVAVAYGCHVVVTNPTSSRQRIDVLLQIPRGAMPISNGQYTRSLHLDLEPYNTQTVDYFFYFPSAGDFPHYPVQVAKNEKLIAWAEPVTLKVVEKLSKVDTTSWDYVSQNGSPEEVVEYLKQNNLNRTDLKRIAWRMADKDYFLRVIALLDSRHAYNQTLWSYGLKHNVVAAAREFLRHHDSFVSQCGAWIDTPLLSIDPVERLAYQHLEYSPFVNARAHKLSSKREIVNDRFLAQYKSLMRVLSYREKLDHDDLMAVTYYLLLQDRIEEALTYFKQVDAAKLATRLQYDYFTVYVDFFNDRPQAARSIVKSYADYPVDRWRKFFANVGSQLDEIEGQAPKVVDTENRAQLQGNLAETETTFDFKVEARKITVDYQNLAECTVNYYLMDIELMFSRQPFVQEFSGQFSFIRPNLTATVKLAATGKSQSFDLPTQFHSSNVLVEIVGGGVRKSKTYYANSLAVQIAENYGQVKVAHEKSDKALPKVYVKVYAKMKDGQVKFYKDGYTDLRGRFDYASLSTNEIDFVDKFAILVLSEADGAVVREASPPKQ